MALRPTEGFATSEMGHGRMGGSVFCDKNVKQVVFLNVFDVKTGVTYSECYDVVS